MTISQNPTWYKDCVIYELHVRAFCDGIGDGNGDFTGLLRKLPYLRDLGVDCLWLLPFYPSPLKDDGYDIANYTDIHPDYGTMKSFRKFLKEAHRLGMKVVSELVVNHTSDQHPWFQRARRAPKGSADRNWYVWSDTPDRWPDVRIIFTDTEPSNWSWDPVAGQYYWHRFFSHQPDLNFDHPPVQKAIERVLKFWLDEGIDGLRLDAIPYLFERDGTNGENLPETHEYIRRLRKTLDKYEPKRVFLAEANQWPEDVRAYFGEGDECHMAFHFPLMPRLFMALSQEDRHPVVEIMRRTPEIPENCQWALFLRNHDELTLEMVTHKERDYMLRSYAAHPRMRINVGIRRRLAPLLENSRQRIELLTSILLSMPGTPVLYYGDEIGMGDNIYLGDRNGVRTPMQWSPDRNAGFSPADPSRLYAPPIQDPVYHFAAVNVEAQERDPSSLLAWNRRMLRLRKTSAAFGRGSIEFLEPANRRILAYLRRYEGDVILVVANLSRYPQPFALELAQFHGMVPVEMQGGVPFPQIGKSPWPLALAPWGWLWFKLRPSQVPNSRTLVDLPLIEQEDLESWWNDRGSRVQFLSSILPGWLPGCAWIQSGTHGAIGSPGVVRLEECSGQTVLATLEVSFSEGGSTVFRIPFTAVSEEEAESILARTSQSALCRVRRPDGKLQVIVESLASLTGPTDLQQSLESKASTALEWELATQLPQDGQGALVSVVGKHHISGLPCGAILKWYHEGGSSAERSKRILGYLGDRGFRRSPKLLGTARSRRDGELCGLLLERIENQGRLDSRLEHELVKFLEGVQSGDYKAKEDSIQPSQVLFHELAGAIQELHTHLEIAATWEDHQRGLFAGTTREMLTRASRILQPRARDAQRRLRDQLWGRASDLLRRIPDEAWTGSAHGDLHLGQMLLRNDEIVFLDFDGGITDTGAPQPSMWDIACLAWSGWKLAGVGDQPDSVGRKFWLDGFLNAICTAPEGTNGQLLELCLLRRWAEELCSKGAQSAPDASKFLLGTLAWPSKVG
ncbi:MAG: maltose alpha-D-glucosyltransferase [Fibrobacterota bacterium]|nr:maltose alpha-D-glucosyltransferase [Fibrobacterota bacterium]QQS04330.1 MAG: maltose alpha-D-glucosyltransferase [Fibrobacterota bacterium]